MMPLGIRCSAVLTPLITKVWPALWPPWKRTTPWALSVSQSTSLPLPSSPHWVPTTTTLRPLVAFISIFLKRISRPIARRPESARDRNGTHQLHSHGPARHRRRSPPGRARTLWRRVSRRLRATAHVLRRAKGAAPAPPP